MIRCDLCCVLCVARCVVLRFSVLLCVSYLFFGGALTVRREVGTDVRLYAFTVAILAQGTNRGDALCAALLSNRVVSIRGESIFLIFSCSSSSFFFLHYHTRKCGLHLKERRPHAKIRPPPQGKATTPENIASTSRKGDHTMCLVFFIFARALLFSFCFSLRFTSFLVKQKAHRTASFLSRRLFDCFFCMQKVMFLLSKVDVRCKKPTAPEGFPARSPTTVLAGPSQA